ncbi:MAG: hypothetical protein IJ392_02490 [Clostridia bacterium]|nr:hypothetical protein [Clostridia bacterium]
MAFYKSKTRFSDTLTLSSGVKSLTLHVDLDLVHTAQRMRKAKENLAEAQNNAMDHRSDETAAAYGQALRELICVVFGQEQTDSLLIFYEGRPDSMIEDIMPYILNKIVPMVNKASRKRAKELAKSR